MSAFGGKADMEMTTSYVAQSGGVSRLKISHRLFAARSIAMIVDRGRLLAGSYRPKPWLCLRCLWVAHDAADYFAVAISHIAIIRRTPIAATASAGLYERKLIQRTRHVPDLFTNGDVSVNGSDALHRASLSTVEEGSMRTAG
jgi:hypothetical protein